jgi:glucan endo-1,3-beta-D-glucosidase
MKTTVYALAFAATLSRANAYWKSFKIQATLANRTCKTPSDWEADFTTIKSLPSTFTNMRVYASSDAIHL